MDVNYIARHLPATYHTALSIDKVTAYMEKATGQIVKGVWWNGLNIKDIGNIFGPEAMFEEFTGTLRLSNDGDYIYVPLFSYIIEDYDGSVFVKEDCDFWNEYVYMGFVNRARLDDLEYIARMAKEYSYLRRR